MQLKDYQQRVVEEVERYLARLAEVRASGERYASQAAWQDCRIPRQYHPRTNGLGEDVPTFTVKVPTGGGKTVVATQILGSLYRTTLAGRNGAGLVLWVVPSSQIYRDTHKRLSDPEDWYRKMLEHAAGRRVEVWQKQDIHRLTPGRLREALNILIIQLASTNRETREQLKFFQDSGGNIVRHFPPEDDPDAHRELKHRIPNLDMIEDDAETGRHLVRTSVGNLVRLCKPPVILDEGHKATSRLARETIEGFNASVVVELSATPKGKRGEGFVYEPNVITEVSGEELLEEEMIKLPMNIATSQERSWESTLTQARDKRLALARKAMDYAAERQEEERRIRPIVLVQVERTGKDQRGQVVNGRRVIHADDVKEYLVQRLDVPERAIAIKTSQKDELNVEGVDIDDPDCPIEWIITKSALQEGWDCPFAYILVSLNNSGSGQAMTQLIGRILRQPNQEKTGIQDLDECYIYCLHKRASTIAREVKQALEKEGYEGDVMGLVREPGESPGRPEVPMRIREEFTRLYTRPFEGKIYLPHFCVKTNGSYEPLDYYRHLISQVDVAAFQYEEVSNDSWHLAEAIAQAKDRYYRYTFGQDDLERFHERDPDLQETDEQVRAWLTASLDFNFLSFKRLRDIVERIYERLCTHEMVKGKLAFVKSIVRDRTEAFVQEQVDRQTEAAFRRLYDEGRLRFYLECAQCRFEIPECITVHSKRRLTHDNGDQIARSLFDYVPEEGQNEYEKAVALCLDHDENVLWWYRNLIGENNYAIQGYRRNRINPDFVVQDKADHKPRHRVLVIESKGEHLSGSPDTSYKRDVARMFEKIGREVTWHQLGQDFKDHTFRFQILDETNEHGRGWSDELRDLLASSD